jgi:hypothetical protein
MAVLVNNLWGYMGVDGQWIMKPLFLYAGKFSDGVAYVELKGGYGFIDKTGKILPLNDSLQNYSSGYKTFSDGLGVVRNHDAKFGFIDTNGSLVIACQFDDVTYFTEGMAGIKQNGKYGYIDKKGTVTVQPQFDLIDAFCDGMARVKLNDKWGFVDKSGAVIAEPQFDDVWNFSQGLACVQKDDKWGYIDKSGKWAVEPQFTSANPFLDDLAVVMRNGTLGYVTKTGDFIPVNSKYSHSVVTKDLEDNYKSKLKGDFKEGLAVHTEKYGEKCGYISVKTND